MRMGVSESSLRLLVRGYRALPHPKKSGCTMAGPGVGFVGYCIDPAKSVRELTGTGQDVAVNRYEVAGGAQQHEQVEYGVVEFYFFDAV